MTAPLVFLDTETDGVHPLRKPWEFAAIRREPNGEQYEVHFFIDIDLTWSDPFGLKVGRFYDRHPMGMWLSGAGQVKNVPEPQEPGDPFANDSFLSQTEAADRIARVTHGAHIVGAVPNFDTGCLDPFLRDRHLIPSWHYHLIDVEALAVGYLAAARVADAASAGAGTGLPHVDPSDFHPPWSSDQLSELVGVPAMAAEERHTALGDARWAMRIYDAIMGDAS